MKSRSHRFRVVDVFKDRPPEGNVPAAFAEAKVYSL
jgi:hypothetical protein